MDKGLKEAMLMELRRSCQFRPPIARFCSEQVNSDMYQEVLRQYVIPWGPDDIYPDEKYVFRQVNSGSHCQDHLLDSGGLASTFIGPEPTELLYLKCFAGKSHFAASGQSDHPTSVHRHGIGPASSSGIHPQACHSFRRCPEATIAKWNLH
jgi:hypothetical protein